MAVVGGAVDVDVARKVSTSPRGYARLAAGQPQDTGEDPVAPRVGPARAGATPPGWTPALEHRAQGLAGADARAHHVAARGVRRLPPRLAGAMSGGWTRVTADHRAVVADEFQGLGFQMDDDGNHGSGWKRRFTTKDTKNTKRNNKAIHETALTGNA